jgi:hypothetical protein
MAALPFVLLAESPYGFFDPDTEIGDTNLSSKHVHIPLISK